MYAVHLEQFEGPLDLLLDMIESEQLDISLVSLSRVTDGYLRYVEEHPEIPPEELADFLVVASKLLLIKSRTLLPFLETQAEEEAGDLESQLRIYKEYLDASKKIEALIGKRRFLYVHDKLPKVDIGFAPPTKFGPDDLVALYRAVIARLEPLVKVPKAVVERVVSIHEKIQRIRTLITSAEKVRFSKVLAEATSKTEIIVSFLALLELVKQRSVSVSQDRRWGDILIERQEAAEGAEAMAGESEPAVETEGAVKA
jgi:segregation and condensation protein A